MADGDISITVHDEAVTMDNAYANKTRPRPCDHQLDLYVLQPEKLFKGDKADSVKGKQNCNPNNLGGRQCERHYSTHKIPHSNLLLLVIDTSCTCEKQRQKIETEEVRVNETLHCERPQESLFRLRPSVCLSYHPEVIEKISFENECEGFKLFCGFRRKRSNSVERAVYNRHLHY